MGFNLLSSKQSLSSFSSVGQSAWAHISTSDPVGIKAALSQQWGVGLILGILAGSFKTSL